jgi:hypothetical protein
MSSTNAAAAASISAPVVPNVPASPVAVSSSPNKEIIVENNLSSDSSAKSAASRFSNNRYSPLFKPESHIYNRTAPSVFLPKDLIKKNKSTRVTGSSKGPGPFTTTRKEIVTARKEAEIVAPKVPAFKNSKAFDTYRSRTVHRRHDQALEEKARVVQANISELYAQKELLNQRIEALKDERAEAISVSRGQPNFRVARKANEGGIAGSSRARDVRSPPSGSSSDPRLHLGSRLSPDPKSFTSIAMTGNVSEGDIILLRKPSNPAFAVTDKQYRSRHEKWSGGESEQERLARWEEKESDREGRG